MKDVLVRLSWSQVMLGAQAGVLTNVQSLSGGRTPSAGCPIDGTLWINNIEGRLAEIAAALHYGLFWGHIGKLDADDAGPLQVRCVSSINTKRGYSDLLLRPGDRKHVDKPWLSVIPVIKNGDQIFTDWVLQGWLFGRDCMQDRWLSSPDPKRPPCWLVPKSELRELDDPELLELLHGDARGRQGGQ